MGSEAAQLASPQRGDVIGAVAFKPLSPYRLKRLSIPRRRPVSEAIVPVRNPDPNPAKGTPPAGRETGNRPAQPDMCIPDTPPSQGGSASPFSPVLAPTPPAPCQAAIGSQLPSPTGRTLPAPLQGHREDIDRNPEGAPLGDTHIPQNPGRAPPSLTGLRACSPPLLRVHDPETRQGVVPGTTGSEQPPERQTSRHFPAAHLADKHMAVHETAGAAPQHAASEHGRQPAGFEPRAAPQQGTLRDPGQGTLRSQPTRSLLGIMRTQVGSQPGAGANMAGAAQSAQLPAQHRPVPAGFQPGSSTEVLAPCNASGAGVCSAPSSKIGGMVAALGTKVLGSNPVPCLGATDPKVSAAVAGQTWADGGAAGLRTRPLAGAGLFKPRRKLQPPSKDKIAAFSLIDDIPDLRTLSGSTALPIPSGQPVPGRTAPGRLPCGGVVRKFIAPRPASAQQGEGKQGCSGPDGAGPHLGTAPSGTAPQRSSASDAPLGPCASQGWRCAREQGEAARWEQHALRGAGAGSEHLSRGTGRLRETEVPGGERMADDLVAMPPHKLPLDRDGRRGGTGHGREDEEEGCGGKPVSAPGLVATVGPRNGVRCGLQEVRQAAVSSRQGEGRDPAGVPAGFGHAGGAVREPTGQSQRSRAPSPPWKQRRRIAGCSQQTLPFRATQQQPVPTRGQWDDPEDQDEAFERPALGNVHDSQPSSTGKRRRRDAAAGDSAAPAMASSSHTAKACQGVGGQKGLQHQRKQARLSGDMMTPVAASGERKRKARSTTSTKRPIRRVYDDDETSDPSARKKTGGSDDDADLLVDMSDVLRTVISQNPARPALPSPQHRTTILVDISDDPDPYASCPQSPSRPSSPELDLPHVLSHSHRGDLLPRNAPRETDTDVESDSSFEAPRARRAIRNVPSRSPLAGRPVEVPGENSKSPEGGRPRRRLCKAGDIATGGPAGNPVPGNTPASGTGAKHDCPPGKAGAKGASRTGGDRGLSDAPVNKAGAKRAPGNPFASARAPLVDLPVLHHVISHRPASSPDSGIPPEALRPLLQPLPRRAESSDVGYDVLDDGDFGFVDDDALPEGSAHRQSSDVENDVQDVSDFGFLDDGAGPSGHSTKRGREGRAPVTGGRHSRGRFGGVEPEVGQAEVARAQSCGDDLGWAHRGHRDRGFAGQPRQAGRPGGGMEWVTGRSGEWDEENRWQAGRPGGGRESGQGRGGEWEEENRGQVGRPGGGMREVPGRCGDWEEENRRQVGRPGGGMRRIPDNGGDWEEDDSVRQAPGGGAGGEVIDLSSPASAPQEGTGPGGEGGQQEWWRLLPDFVPVSVLRSGVNPRDGSKVYIDYAAQFRGGPPGVVSRRQPAPGRTAPSAAGGSGGGQGRAARGRGGPKASGWRTRDGQHVFVTPEGVRTGRGAYLAHLKDKGGRTSSGRGQKRRRQWKRGRGAGARHDVYD